MAGAAAAGHLHHLRILTLCSHKPEVSQPSHVRATVLGDTHQTSLMVGGYAYHQNIHYHLNKNMAINYFHWSTNSYLEFSLIAFLLPELFAVFAEKKN